MSRLKDSSAELKGGCNLAVKRTKLINTSRVMREIWISRETSRIEIARALGLDKSTISSIVSGLLDLGVIRESREGSVGPQGGRRPVHITLNNEYGFVLGLELRPESYSAVGVNLDGEVGFSRFEKMEIRGHDLRDTILEIVDRVRADLDHTGLPLLGIGAGLSGVVDPDLGVIKYSIPLKLEQEVDLYESMRGDFDFPFFIENDANACAWGELAFHRQRDLRDFLFVLVELRDTVDLKAIHERTAVGLGVAIDGKVHYGYERSAGEFRSIFRSAQSEGQFSLTHDDSFRITEDPAILNRFLTELAKHVALLVNTFNLSHVFVGGTLEWAYNDLAAILRTEINANWPYPNDVGCKVAFSSLGDRAVAYGAAGMVLDRMFADLETMSGLADLRSQRDQLLHGWPERA
ncbi:MAG: ROK family transcriptional regulator [Spirochaetia bacterium]